MAQAGRIKGQHQRHPERRLLGEERLRAFIEQSPLTVYINRLDEARSNVYTSPQLEASLGYADEEWGEDEDLLFKLIHPEDRERISAEHRRTRGTREPFRLEAFRAGREAR